MLLRLIKSIVGRGKERAVAHAKGSIYVCLAGGLGNQLFQYAFARFLSTQGISISGLVTSLFDRDTYQRRLLLNALARIPTAILSKDELAALKIIANDNGMAVRDALMQTGQTDVICQGYWQDARYANSVAAELAGDLKAFGERNHNFNNAPFDCVLHVRRHDYGHLGLLPLAYYRAALQHCGGPPFKVVTDEPNFCEYVFAGIEGYAGVVRGNYAEPWNDFFLMANGRIQIIANSSFSWWTAWLGRATGSTQTVIAPAEWSLQKEWNPCPADWHRIETRLTRP
jgi:Glycosyl transferase family 11